MENLCYLAITDFFTQSSFVTGFNVSLVYLVSLVVIQDAILEIKCTH